MFEHRQQSPLTPSTTASIVRGVTFFLCACNSACSFDTASSEPGSSRSSGIESCALSDACSMVAVSTPNLPPTVIAARETDDLCNHNWFADARGATCREPAQAGWSFFRAMAGKVPELVDACEYVWTRSSRAPEEGPLPQARQEPTRSGCDQGRRLFPKVTLLDPACSGSSCLSLLQAAGARDTDAFAGSDTWLAPSPIVSKGGGRPIYYDPAVRRLWTLAALKKVKLNQTQYEIPGTGMYEFASSPNSVNVVQYTTDGQTWTTLWEQ